MESANIVNNRGRLPSDLNQVITVARYDLLKHLRSKRLLGLLVLEAVLLGLMFIVPILLDQPTAENPADHISSYIQWVNILVVLGATMFAGDAIVSEFQNRTGYLLFPNPVKRSVIFAGKYLSTMLIVLLMLVSYYGVAALLTLIMTGGSSELWVYSMLFAMCYGAAAAAFGFLISSLFKGSTGSLVLTFFALLMIIPMVSALLTLGNIEPFFLLTYSAGAITALMQTPYPQNYSPPLPPMGGGEQMTYWYYFPDVGVALAVLAAYVVICLLLGFFLFKRREMVS